MNQEYEKGIQHYQAGEYREAEQALLASIREHPEHAMSFNKLGLIYVKIENYTRAKECFNKALELDLGLVHAWNNLANLARQAGELEEAKNYYTKALELEPNNPVPMRNLTQVEKQMKRSPGFFRNLWQK